MMLSIKCKCQIKNLLRGMLGISLSLVMSGVPAGCADNHLDASASQPPMQQVAPPVLQDQWLLIHIKSHTITGIGTYKLPQAIVFPARLTPLPQGLFIKVPHSKTFPVQVFFEPTNEQDAWDWAHKGAPLFAPSDPGYWYSKHSEYFSMTSGALSPHAVAYGDPSHVPLSWSVYGVFSNKHWSYSVEWTGKPVVTAFKAPGLPPAHLPLPANVMNALPYPLNAVQYVGVGGGDFGLHCPLAGLKRVVSLFVNWSPQDVRAQWLPVHFSNHRITAIGPHVLPRPILLPAQLKPLSQAVVHWLVSTPSRLGYTIFFTPEEEQAVKTWALSYPVVLQTTPSATWMKKSAFFCSGQKAPDGDYLLSCPPTSPNLVGWNVYGTLQAGSASYGIGWKGVAVVTAADLKNNPKAQLLLNVGVAADYVGPGSIFDADAPFQLRQEKRHVEIYVSF